MNTFGILRSLLPHRASRTSFSNFLLLGSWLSRAKRNNNLSLSTVAFLFTYSVVKACARTKNSQSLLKRIGRFSAEIYLWLEMVTLSSKDCRIKLSHRTSISIQACLTFVKCCGPYIAKMALNMGLLPRLKMAFVTISEWLWQPLA